MFFPILVVFLLLGGLVTLIAVQNLTQSVQLDLFFWSTPALPVGVWLIAAFLLGAVALYLVSVLSAVGDRREIKALRQQALALEGQMKTISQTSSPSARQTPEDGLSSANTGPMIAMPGVMNTPQPDGRIPSSPLPPLQHFRQ